jgi:hypothetical protein
LVKCKLFVIGGSPSPTTRRPDSGSGDDAPSATCPRAQAALFCAVSALPRSPGGAPAAVAPPSALGGRGRRRLEMLSLHTRAALTPIPSLLVSYYSSPILRRPSAMKHLPVLNRSTLLNRQLVLIRSKLLFSDGLIRCMLQIKQNKSPSCC